LYAKTDLRSIASKLLRVGDEPAPFAVLVRGRIISRYPVAPSLLVLPLVVPQIALLDWRESRWERNTIPDTAEVIFEHASGMLTIFSTFDIDVFNRSYPIDRRIDALLETSRIWQFVANIRAGYCVVLLTTRLLSELP
jgi:hypothetical protein